MDQIPKLEKISHKSPEGKNTFRTRLNAIVGQSITTANIDTFADSVLDELVSFTGEIVEQYKTEHPEDTSAGKELEDRAFAAYGLEDLNEYLVRVQEKSDQIHRFDAAMQNMNHTSEVITPPDKNGAVASSGGDNHFKERVQIPRLKLLLYILDNDFNIKPEDITLTRGIVTDKMMRKESYITVEIDSLHRVVQVCDEEANASYVFDTEITTQENISIDDMNFAGKEEKKELMEKFKGIGTYVKQQPHWRDVMSELLSSPINGNEKKVIDYEKEKLPKVITSEFDPWRGFIESGDIHWGTAWTISNRLKLSYGPVFSYIKDHPDLPSKKVLDLMGRKKSAYSLEQIYSGFKKFIFIPKVQTSGEWRGFFESDGMHWGTMLKITERFDEISFATVKSYIKEHPETPSKKMKNLGGIENDVYPLEQIALGLKEIISLPQVDKSGEWLGFLENEHTHFGSVRTIARYLKIHKNNINRLIKKNLHLKTKKVRDLSGRKITAYSLEEIEKLLSGGKYKAPSNSV